MILTLDEVKVWLRVDGEADDTSLLLLIATAEQYLSNATGIEYDSTNTLAKLFCMSLISDWYENREHVSREHVGRESDRTRFTIKSMLMQLTYGGEHNESSTTKTSN